MEKKITLELPSNLSRAQLNHDLGVLSDGILEFEIRETSEPSSQGKLGQIDGGIVDIVISILDTQAAAESVRVTLAAISGYLFAKTGKNPDLDDKNE